jgi:hypothetical protein
LVLQCRLTTQGIVMNPFAIAQRLGAALVLLASLLLPFAAAAADPPERVVRIGHLGLNPPLLNVSSARLPLALAKLGYIEGKNLVIEIRHAGGNLTGTESLAPELDAEKELGITVSSLAVRRVDDFDPVFAAAAGKPLGAVLTLTSNMTFRNWSRIREFAQANRLPTLCEFRFMAENGCLLSYGPTFDEITQRCAAQIDKILRGDSYSPWIRCTFARSGGRSCSTIAQTASRSTLK